MMFSTLLFATLLLQTAQLLPLQQATPAPAPQVEWVVFVAAPVYQPDGGLAAETVALPANGAGLVHLFSRRTICEPAASGAAEPSDAAFGWRVASQIVNRNEREVVVSINWRRMWDDGRKIPNGPGSTVQLTLHQGDRIPLDHIANLKPRPECRAVGLGLEVRLAQAAIVPATPVLPLGSIAGGAKPIDAEFWLVHTSPSDVQQVVHQTVRLPPGGGTFGFAPTSISSARGTASVELTGSIDRYRTPAGEEFMLLSLTRRVKGPGLPAEGVPASTGGVPVPLPPPTDVLSFEMPGTGRGRIGAGGAVAAAGARGGGGAARTGGAASGLSAGQGGARAGGGGGGGGRGGVNAAALAQVAALLEGHQMALRMRVTQIN